MHPPSSAQVFSRPQCGASIQNVDTAGLSHSQSAAQMATLNFPSSQGQVSVAQRNFHKLVDVFYMRASIAVKVAQHGSSDVCKKALGEIDSALMSLQNAASEPGVEYGNLLNEIGEIYSSAVSQLSLRLEVLGSTENSKQRSADDQPGQSQKQSDTAMSSVSKASCYVKKMETPRWDGEYRSYPHFKSRFTMTIQKYVDDDNALLRLRDESLVFNSHAYHLVKSKSTMEEAWSALDSFYGDPRKVKSIIQRDLRAIPAIRQMSDSKAMRRMVTEVMSAKEDLASIGLDDLLGDLIVDELLTKLPVQLRSKIDGKLLENSYTSQGKIDLLMSSIEHQALLTETHSLRTDAMHSGQSIVDSGSGSSDNRKRAKSAHGNVHLTSTNGSQSQSVSKRKDKKGSKNSPPSGNGKSAPPSGSSGGKSPPSNGKSSAKCVFHPDLSDSHSTQQCHFLTTKSGSELRKGIKGHRICLLCVGDHETDRCFKKGKIQCNVENCKNIHHDNGRTILLCI